MKKRILSLLLAACLLIGLVPTLAPQAQALDLLTIFDGAGSIVRGAMNAAEQAKSEKWSFGEALAGSFKSIGMELLGIEKDEAPGATIIVEEVDLSEVEMELSKIQSTLQNQNITLTQIKQEMNTNMQTISSELSKLSSKIENESMRIQYHTYLTNFFSFYNQFYEAVSYYDQALTTLYAGNPTQQNIKNTFDQFYELRNVAYSGNFYSSIDQLGKYLRGEYLSTDPGSVVDILCQYYTLAGYSQAEVAAAVKDFVAQTYYTYCLAVYYYLSLALFQDTYLSDNHLVDYPTDFGTQLNATQIKQLAMNVLDNCAATTAHVFHDLNQHFCSLDELLVSYKGSVGYASRTIRDSKMDVEPNSSIVMPDTTSIMEAYLGSGYTDLFGGMCVYSYTSADSSVSVDGNTLTFGALANDATVNVTINCAVAEAAVPLHQLTFTGKSSNLAGLGTQEYPYVITNVEEFKSFTSGYYNDAVVSLRADLDLGGESIFPVLGDFSGVFYGNGHTISNFKLTDDYQNLGLFTSISGRVMDLTVKNATVQPYTNGGGVFRVGVIVGKLHSKGQLIRCEAVDSSASYMTDSSGAGYVGGLVGEVNDGQVIGCISRNIEVALGYNGTSGCIGGLVGYLSNGTVRYSGREEGMLWQYQCSNKGTSSGGLIGEVYNSSVKNCWNYKTTASISDQPYYDSYRCGSFFGYCENLDSDELYIYNGSNALESYINFVTYGQVRSGYYPIVYERDDFTCSKIAMDGAGYLTNISGNGNPVRLQGVRLELITDDVKTSYQYGEPLTIGGLFVRLNRGSELVTIQMAPYSIETDYNAEKPGTYTVKIQTDDCGEASYTVTVGNKPHVFKQVLVPSTCTEDGSVYYVCQDEGCNATYGEKEVLPARGHVLVHHDAITADCDQIAKREYWYCSVCEKFFLDEACTKETVEENLAVPGTEHDLGTPTYEWSKTDDGYTCVASVACTRENCPEYPASKPITETGTVSAVITEATCTKTGLAIYTATFTNSLFATQTKEEVLPTIPCPSEVFTDVIKSQWYHEGIDFAITSGLFNGTSKTTFEPDTSMTRAMLVTVLWRLDGKPEVTGENPFLDVANGQWFTEPIIWASENGIVNGTGHGQFEPDASVTREQMATILYRYAQKKGYDVSASADLGVYPDANQVNGWAKTALAWANAAGLVTGSKEQGVVYLLPAGEATRAQVATILMRYVKNIVK